MRINEKTFEIEKGRITIGFPPDFDVEAFIQERVYGPDKMEIRYWSESTARWDHSVPDYSDAWREMSDEDKKVAINSGKELSGHLDEKGRQMIQRACERDERYLRNNFSVVCPTERLLKELLYWAQCDRRQYGYTPPIQEEMLKLAHFLREIRAECVDPSLWNTTKELPFPEDGVPMSGHPRAPEAFLRLRKMTLECEDGNLVLCPGDPRYEEFAKAQKAEYGELAETFEEGSPVYLNNDIPSALAYWGDNWGDVSFVVKRDDCEE